MEKGINLQGQINAGSSGASVQSLSQSLPDVFAKANPGLQLKVTSVAHPDASGKATIHVYIHGDQEPAADFAALTRGALTRAIAALNTDPVSYGVGNPATVAGGKPAVQLHNVQEVEGDAEDSGVVLPPSASPLAPGAPATHAPAPSVSAADLPMQAADPAPASAASGPSTSSGSGPTSKTASKPAQHTFRRRKKP